MSLDFFSTFTDSPPEIIDKIVSYIDHPSDLLHLPLTSKMVCQLISPEHIKFRVIRLNLNRPLLWRKLTTFRSRLSNIVVLEIVAGIRL